MNPFNKLFFYTTLGFALSILSSCEQERTLKSEETIVSEYAYKNFIDKFKDKGTGRFEQVETYYDYTNKILVNGEVDDEISSYEDEIVDTGAGEHGHVWLEYKNGIVWCHHDFLKIKHGIDQRLQYVAEMKIVQGSWESYQLGGVLVLSSTEAGHISREAALREMFAKTSRENQIAFERIMANENGESFDSNNLELKTELEFLDRNDMTLKAQADTIEITQPHESKLKITTHKKIYNN